MGKHNYTKCIIHMVWGTKRRKPVLKRPARKKLSQYLYSYANDKDIFMHINYVNADHVHALIDLHTTYALKEVFKLFKGSSSYWINQHNLTTHKFRWARGYGAFSVSASALGTVKNYIQNQEEHHRTKKFTEEYESFIRAYGLKVRNR